MYITFSDYDYKHRTYFGVLCHWVANTQYNNPGIPVVHLYARYPVTAQILIFYSLVLKFMLNLTLDFVHQIFFSSTRLYHVSVII